MYLRMDSPMANIMAVIAVFDTHAEAAAVTAPNANSTRPGRAPTHSSESTVKATRRSSPFKKIPRAKMNEPMNKNMS
jgi:hypothetical protein